MGLNIDAEEQDRLASVPESDCRRFWADPDLAGWDGFRRGRAGLWQARRDRSSTGCTDLAEDLDRRIMVRLVKGAYWDTEMKLRAGRWGLPDFALFTSKTGHGCQLYCALAKKLLGLIATGSTRNSPRTTPTASRPILELAGTEEGGARDFEFQRLHGMGERLHDIVLRRTRRPAAASMPPSGRIATCWPIWCGVFWRTGRTVLLRAPDRRRGCEARRRSRRPV